MTFGWLRPLVLLPATALTGLSEGQLLAVLAHELAHVRRHDFVVNTLQRVIESVLFYHPAVWWLSARIRVERERCCDDLAVGVCGDRLLYAQALIELDRARGTKPDLAIAATTGRLTERLHRLFGIHSVDRHWQPVAVALALLIVCSLGGMWTVETATAPSLPLASLAPPVWAPPAPSARRQASIPTVERAAAEIGAIVTAQTPGGTAAQTPVPQNGTIFGRVLNWDGTPAIGVSVAIEPSPPGGVPLLKRSLAGLMQTDSAGRYRFENIPAGKYLVAAGMPRFTIGSGGPAPEIPLPTFYPGVTEPTKAEAVGPDSKQPVEIEFRLSRPISSNPLFHASGKVAGMTARDRLEPLPGRARTAAPGRTNLTVYFYSSPGIGDFPPVSGRIFSNSAGVNCGAHSQGADLLRLEGVGHVTPDGRYEVRNLPAGRYRACLLHTGGAATVDNLQIGPDNATVDFDIASPEKGK
jgi:hypothetical protein